MSNNGTHQEKLIRLEEERRFLLLGLNYAEVASKTGLKIRTISEHNRLIHKVDMKKAFALRIQREGTPNHLPKNDVINSWITGLMDAEGCFIFDLSPLSKDGYFNVKLGVDVSLRIDDINTLQLLRDHLGVGNININPRKNNEKWHPLASWRCAAIQDLIETVVPLFDKFPLQSKKGKEFLLWKELVIDRYIQTVGGFNKVTRDLDQQFLLKFEQAIQTVKQMRHYPIIPELYLPNKMEQEFKRRQLPPVKRDRAVDREKERQLLLDGYNYDEVASITGKHRRGIKERNIQYYKIDLRGAFRCRIEQDGIPDRSPKDKKLNAWFVGLFDGEGTFVAYKRFRSDGHYPITFTLGIHLKVRADDTYMINLLENHFQIGCINYHKPEIGKNAQIGWQCRRLKDLAEVIIPVFEKIPLRTKKGKEFLMWKDLILQRYVDTCGGRFRSGGTRQSYHLLFDETEQSLRKMRGYVYKE
jgi:hypothetical protein